MGLPSVALLNAVLMLPCRLVASLDFYKVR